MVTSFLIKFEFIENNMYPRRLFMKKIFILVAIVLVAAALILYIKTNFSNSGKADNGTMVKGIENEYFKQRI